MPDINFSFSGWMTHATIEEVWESDTGKTLDVRGVDAAVLCQKLGAGEWFISLKNCLDNAGPKNSEVAIFDYDLPI
tara:strand:- start:792 stop:1019 length:228 start_codon:yes stop_codon:yes gene_type:complete